jgi:hypothetical protein
MPQPKTKRFNIIKPLTILCVYSTSMVIFYTSMIWLWILKMEKQKGYEL